MKNERPRPSYLGPPIETTRSDIMETSFKNGAGEIVLSDCDLYLLEQWAMGKRRDELGLSSRSSLISRRFASLRSLGVEIPKLKEEGFPTGIERRILHALDEGARNAREISEMTDIYYSCIRVHIYNMRRKGINVPKLARSGKKR